VRVLGISRHSSAALVRQHSRLLHEAMLDLGDIAAVTAWIASGAMGHFIANAERALLVNNAGVIQPIGPLETQDASLVARAITVNVTAAFMLSAAFVQATSRLNERRILHVSSGAGRKPYAGWSIYCATKAAMDHHARCIALDRTPALRIVSVAPGVVDTEMQSEIRASTDEQFPDRPRFVAMHRDHTLPPPDRIGGKLVDFLLSGLFGNEAVFDLRDFSA
jgi:NAD(P)-dependent dehydrogenase (short-subunit alcohol dehydrogenase family)